MSSTPSSACSPASLPWDDVVASWKVGVQPLIGRVLSSRPAPQGEACPDAPARDLAQAIEAAAAEGGMLLIGEQHDNAEHHRFQASIAKTLADKKPAVVFEQFRTNQQRALDATAKRSPPPTLAEFKSALDWDKSGWAKYNYDPLLKAALDAKLPLFAGDVPREAIKRVAKEGEGALPPEDRARLKLDVPLGDKLSEASIAEIAESHCGMLPKEAMPGMAIAQRYRDASLADVLLNAAATHGSAILIAGNGHARTDRGVPWYIRQRAPEKKIVSVMLIEVEEGKTDPEAYIPRDPDGKPAADYVIFTPPTKRDDPCEAMNRKAP